jgi:hypothetical protein
LVIHRYWSLFNCGSHAERGLQQEPFHIEVLTLQLVVAAEIGKPFVAESNEDVLSVLPYPA